MQRYAILLIAVLFAQFVSGSVHAATACANSGIVGGAQSAGQSAARKAAIADWRNRAAASRGPLWSNWSIAGNRQVNCKPAKNGSVQCKVKARPCKELGSPARRYKLVK